LVDGGIGSPPVGGKSSGSGPRPSSGCGKPLPAQQVQTIPGSRTGYTEWNVDLKGENLGALDPSRAGPRQFFVRVPLDYDSSKPYRLVYIGSGCGAQHAGKTNTSPLFNEAQGGSEQAVYVGLSVADNAVNPGCYDNNAGPQSQEWEAFEAIHTLVERSYCVDNDRIYVAGHSTGATLANQWSCYFGGASSPPLDQPDLEAGRATRKFAPQFAIRGALGVTGFLPRNQPKPCNGPAAHLWIHDLLDKSNLLNTEIDALDLALKTNGCTGSYADGPKRPWAPAEAIAGLEGGICQEYTGCAPDVAARYPIVFCSTTGYGHADQAQRSIPAFTRFMEQVDAAAPE